MTTLITTAQSTIDQLNNHLFSAIARLNNDNLTVEEINAESERAKSIIGLSDQIIKGVNATNQSLQIISRNFDASQDQGFLLENRTRRSSGG
ncbi:MULTISPECIES: hypothetical protein [Glaesserella]|uniref:Uncharacterized protein n=1 Tax=Glaesserella australis TaxID=2094024 RepID=A0A328C418_9PAST|nr:MULTISPECIES: hypothetical protein [Glaesserella]AUI65583.1 hypothetical protein CJD39_02865 [Glaesserella sp. 15-184]RAL19780.1 hypothetical protein C5N92_01950 [Glaesserella australis]